MDSPDLARVRILHSLAENEILAEMRARGADYQAVEQLRSRASWRGALFLGLPMEQSVNLRKLAKEAGVQAFLCRSLSKKGRGREIADVITAGTAEGLRRLSDSLQEEEAGLGQALAQALANWQGDRRREWQCGNRRLALGEKTLVMGILNVTPDSFSGDGLGGEGNVEKGLQQAKQMAAEGADILDVGGESSRPGAEPVPVEEELHRVIPLIEKIVQEIDVPVSIDTTKAKVAAEALARGACIINDISGMRMDEEMAPVAVYAKAGVILMHMLGTPRDMQEDPKYVDLIGEITAFLAEASERALIAGVSPEQIVIDPGFGFGKMVEHNLEILRRLEEFRGLGYPVLIGTSRKSTIGKILETETDERLEGTAATVALAIAGGADIIRVHDVKEMAKVAKMADAVLRVKPPEINEDEYVKWGESQE